MQKQKKNWKELPYYKQKLIAGILNQLTHAENDPEPETLSFKSQTINSNKLNETDTSMNSKENNKNKGKLIMTSPPKSKPIAARKRSKLGRRLKIKKLHPMQVFEASDDRWYDIIAGLMI